MASRGERRSQRLTATLLTLIERRSARPRLFERRGREGPDGRIARAVVSTHGFPGQRLGELARRRRTAPRPARAATPSRNGTPIGIGFASALESKARLVSVFGRCSSRQRFQKPATCEFAETKRGSTRRPARNQYQSGVEFSRRAKTDTNRGSTAFSGAADGGMTRPGSRKARGRRC